MTFVENQTESNRMTEQEIMELERLLPAIIALANLIRKQAEVHKEARQLLAPDCDD